VARVSEIQIRLAVTAEDVESAAHLFEGEIRLDAIRRFLGHSAHHLFLAFDGDQPVGMLTAIELTYPDRGTEMFIHDMRVAESHRGSRIGHAMLDQLEALAQDTRCEGVWVVTGTGDKNAGARATFASRGAEEDRERVRYSWRVEHPAEDRSQLVPTDTD
jgi:ribosomal-protein-alanine N-acetyltransferase